MIRETMQEKTTEELLAMYKAHDTDEWRPEALEIMREILIERGALPAEDNDGPGKSITSGGAAPAMRPEEADIAILPTTSSGKWADGFFIVFLLLIRPMLMVGRQIHSNFQFMLAIFVISGLLSFSIGIFSIFKRGERAVLVFLAVGVIGLLIAWVPAAEIYFWAKLAW